MYGATVKITTGYVEGQDSLGFLAPIGSPIASAGFDGPSGALTLTGWASPAQYEAALRTVLYNNLSHPPGTAPRIVTFEVVDPIYGVATATRQITVMAANKAPTASADAYSAIQPNALTVPAPGLLANDADPDSAPAPLTAAKVNGPGHGTLSLDAGGGFTYTPASGFVGTDTFTYQVSDGQATSAPATVTIVVNAPSSPVGPATPNRPPVAVAETYSLVHPNLLAVAAPGVLANDTDPDTSPAPLTAVKASDPAHGALDLQANGGFSYRPAPDFAGTDSFTYQARDGESLSAPVTVTITITATACSPRPKVTTSTTPGGGKLVVQVESTALSISGVNPLQQLKFGTLQNAKVTMAGQVSSATQAVTSDQTLLFPASTTTATFTVERAAPGQPTTVPFTIVDGCGEWKSFVGGGAAAGF
jgi:VCBS repeat-containing protein